MDCAKERAGESGAFVPSHPNAVRGSKAGKIPFSLSPVTVVAGHYGVGKTNLSLNLALDAADAGFDVTLADMDVVNPYFRSSEYRDLLEGAGVHLIAPVFGGAGTSLDAPSVTGELSVAVSEAYRDGTGQKVVFVDAGGDDVGATVLARFSSAIAEGPYEMLYVVNALRDLTQSPSQALEVLREIEAKGKLSATAVVGNTHLQDETAWDHIEKGIPYARAVADKASLPLYGVTAPISAIQQENTALEVTCDDVAVYPVRVYVKTPWA